MRRLHLLLPASLLALLPVVAALGASSASAAPPPVAVGVVDVLELINGYPGYKVAKDTLEAAAKAAEAQLELDKKTVAAAEARLKVEIPLDAPNRSAEERSVAIKKILSEFDFKWKVKVAQDTYMTTLIRVHGEVKGYIAKYARDNGIGIVLQMTKEEVTGKSPDELIPNIVVRTVAYHDPNLDITGAVKALFPR